MGGDRAPTHMRGDRPHKPPRRGVRDELGGDAAEDVRPPGSGPDLTRLQQGGPLSVGELREEGVHLNGHVPPGRRGVGVGVWGRGGLAGGVIVPHPAPSVHRYGVGPAGHCLRRGRGRRCQHLEGSKRFTRPWRVGRHMGTPVSSCQSGAKSQRHVHKRPARWASGRGGGEDTRVPLVPNSGPLGPWTVDSQTGPSALVVGAPPPVPRPGEQVPEAQDPRAHPLKGGEDVDVAGPPSPLVGDGEHLGSLPVSPPPPPGAASLGR